MSVKQRRKNMPRKPASELESIEKVKKSASAKEPINKKATPERASTIEQKLTSSKKDSTARKSASLKKASDAKTPAKKTTTKKASSSKTSKSNSTKTTKKDASVSKSTVAKTRATKTSAKSSSSKNSSSKSSSSSTKKSTARKTTAKAKNSNKEIDINEVTSSTDLTKKIEVLEYYDLPYRYNQTVVKVLAQTPTTLFIYWDISDVDRSNFVAQYGEDFFNYTKPVLVIHNNTMHYSFEVEIDDFANSWYLHVNDSNCEYTVELGRRAKYYNDERHMEISNNYLYVTSSNVMDSPNDRVLFDKNLKTVYFRDVKTNIITAKDITSISFIRNMGKIYNLYDLQSNLNETDLVNSKCWQLDFRNPSSSNPSSTFK